MKGGANQESLVDYQQQVLQLIPLSRTQHNGYSRHPAWRPWEPDDGQKEQPAPSTGKEYFEALGEEILPYYWETEATTYEPN